MWKLYIGLNSAGAWMCHRCGTQGSWYDFKRRMGRPEIIADAHLAALPFSQGSPSPRAHPVSSSSHNPQSSVPPMPDQRRARSYAANLMENPSNQHVREYLTGKGGGKRGLSPNVLYKYGVGCATYSFAGEDGYVKAPCITFPWVMLPADLGGNKFNELRASLQKGGNSLPLDSIITRIKARSITNKGWQRLDPSGGRWGLFGWHTIPPEATEVVLTEGEYDAMAVYQGTGMPALSLPNGCRNLPVDVLPLLERFDRIFLWMDNDGPGREGAEKFAKKLGERRCRIVRPPKGERPPKDANEALLSGVDMRAMIDAAAVMPHTDVLHFHDVRSEVLDEILHPGKYEGTPIKAFPLLSAITKGIRRGEVTVLTGPTGAGKTTLLSQFSLDLAEAGINTLWGSFEIKNTRLLKKMLQQFARRSLGDVMTSHPDALQALNGAASSFLLSPPLALTPSQALPLSFMRFHGGTDVDLVIDAMDYAVYANDVEHIILDNLQFMLNSQGGNGRGGGSSWDKFAAQDFALDRFRKFATDRNVHVTLVIHPRKEDESQKLTLSSIFGSAKATQEADIVLLLQKVGEKKSLEVKKNRFDGDLGEVLLYYENHTGRLRESKYN
ncbi:unnamed protein product [Chrysoparadoxa australica]